MPSFSVTPFDRANATDEEYIAYNALQNAVQAESQPHDPPIPLEQTIRDARSVSPLFEERAWAVWNDDHDTLLAFADAGIINTEENSHIAQVRITVARDQRRQGLGRALLGHAASWAAEKQRTLLLMSSVDTVPAGAAFIRAAGGTIGLENKVQSLDLQRVDRQLLQDWLTRAAERGGDLEIGLWDGPYPEEDLERVVAMAEAMNLQPRGELDIQDFHFTAEHIRHLDEDLVRRGMARWTIYVSDPATGAIAGFTEVIWRPTQPTIMHQNGTMVFREYQNRGIGRRLKAAMLEKILAERPEVRYIHTGNAQGNVPMLNINRALGFEPYLDQIDWQVPVEQAQSFARA